MVKPREITISSAKMIHMLHSWESGTATSWSGYVISSQAALKMVLDVYEAMWELWNILFYPEHVLYNSNDQYRQQEELHMTGLGTLINAAAILAGGILGLTFGKFMKPRYQETLTMACGVSVIFLGIAGAMEKMMTVTAQGLVSGAGFYHYSGDERVHGKGLPVFRGSSWPVSRFCYFAGPADRAVYDGGGS